MSTVESKSHSCKSVEKKAVAAISRIKFCKLKAITPVLERLSLKHPRHGKSLYEIKCEAVAAEERQIDRLIQHKKLTSKKVERVALDAIRNMKAEQIKAITPTLERISRRHPRMVAAKH